ncbi:MAG: hypothetical protein ABIQ55_00830 [Gemmatimonadaceae bacterium]
MLSRAPNCDLARSNSRRNLPPGCQDKPPAGTRYHVASYNRQRSNDPGYRTVQSPLEQYFAAINFDYLNAQGQPNLVWPASFALARAYADQLERSNGITGQRLVAIRAALAKAETGPSARRKIDLRKLATSLNADARRSPDGTRVGMLSAAVRDLAR